MILVSDLEFRYPGGEFSLVVSELRVGSRETVALVGPSGSGKTTLLHLVAGIVTPLKGRIEVGGGDGTAFDVTALDDTALDITALDITALDDGARREFRIRHVGLVFQEFELLDYLTVLDNILLPCRLSAALPLDTAARDRATELARRVGLADRLHRHPTQLSQGERQRVAVCRAVLPAPSLLLADEPTGNLDPENARAVLDLLLELAAETDATLLTVTHDHDLLPRFQRVIDVRELSGVGDPV